VWLAVWTHVNNAQSPTPTYDRLLWQPSWISNVFARAQGLIEDLSTYFVTSSFSLTQSSLSSSQLNSAYLLTYLDLCVTGRSSLDRLIRKWRCCRNLAWSRDPRWRSEAEIGRGRTSRAAIVTVRARTRRGWMLSCTRDSSSTAASRLYGTWSASQVRLSISRTLSCSGLNTVSSQPVESCYHSFLFRLRRLTFSFV